MTKISQLSQDTTPQSADQVAIVDSVTGITKRMTFSDLSKIMTTLLLPSGMIAETAMSAAPTGWLVCDGSAISRAAYSALYTAIGTTYGTGDGSTTFNLPDLRGRTPVGVGTAAATGATAHTLAQEGGEEMHTLTSAEQASMYLHKEGGDFINQDGGGTLSGWDNVTGNTNQGQVHSIAVGGGGAHNNMQPYLAINFIIKT